MEVMFEMGQWTKPGALGLVFSLKYRTVHKVKDFFLRKKTFVVIMKFKIGTD